MFSPFATLRATGYDGWLAMEFMQGADSDAAAQRAFATVNGVLQSLDA